MNLAHNRWFELFLLFAVLPIVLALPIPPLFLVMVALVAIVYVFRLMFKSGLLSKSVLSQLPEHFNYNPLIIRFVLFAALTTLAVGWFIPDKLFFVISQNPMLWLAISLFYSLISVVPQELIYRHFFYSRYFDTINPKYYIWFNAALFSLAHLMFMNALVMLLTFAGGILFATTYNKTKSVIVTSIEHAAYGLWLYTVGLGEMLAFPGPNLS